jgi:hypothetical protein
VYCLLTGVPTLVLNSNQPNLNIDDYVDLGNSSFIKLCRAKSKNCTVGIEEMSASISEDDKATASVVEQLHSEDQKFGSTSDPIFVKEINNADLPSILSSLQADKLYLDKQESTFFPEYFDFARNFRRDGKSGQGNFNESEPNVQKSRSNSFVDSLQRVSSLLGLTSNHGSDNSSDEESVLGRNALPAGNIHEFVIIIYISQCNGE